MKKKEQITSYFMGMEIQTESHSKRKKLSYDDYVYLIQNTKSRYVKIGKSRNPEGRLAQLQTATHDPVILLHKIGCREAANTEKLLHTHFGGKRISGEWFDLTQQDIDLILSITADDDPSIDQIKALPKAYAPAMGYFIDKHFFEITTRNDQPFLEAALLFAYIA